jgi:hypothetical protein
MPYGKPPALAMWFLGRFGVNESVVGDLVERYEHRPSSFWFWRQALSAIAASLIRDLRTHKLLTFRAVLVGTLAVWVFSWLTAPPFLWMKQAFSAWTVEHNADVLRVFVFESNAWLLKLPAALPWALAGWTIARLHRQNGLSMIVALISCWFLFLVAVMLRGFLVSASPTSATANVFLATVIPRFLFFVAFTFAGGLVGARPIGVHRQLP